MSVVRCHERMDRWLDLDVPFASIVRGEGPVDRVSQRGSAKL